jgi:phosphatidylinositol glycan class U
LGGSIALRVFACKAPILLPTFSILPDFAFTNTAIGALYTLVDLVNANALEAIADSGEAVSTRLFTSSRRNDRLHSTAVSAAYLLNPFTVAACLGRSTSIFTNTAIVHSISAALEGDVFKAMFALGFAAYLSMYPTLLLPPIALLCWDRTFKSATPANSALAFSLKSGGIFVSTVITLLGLSYVMTGSWEFIPATYGFQLLVPDLTPNIGLWWYFFIEIFDSFRAFFLGVFWLHLASYVGGLTIRLRTQPLFVVTTLLGLFAIFKPYPSISDVSLYFAFLPLYKHVFPRKSDPGPKWKGPCLDANLVKVMRYTFIASSVLLYASLLGPAFYHLWIYAGSGNANFFYAITLVWSLGLAMLVGDSLFAVLRDEWEVERPEMKGKDVRRI